LLQANRKLDIRPGDRRCPRCFEKDVVPSLPRGFVDALMKKFGRIPKHCRFCEKRFYVKEQ
jgi:hypothetical protein